MPRVNKKHFDEIISSTMDEYLLDQFNIEFDKADTKKKGKAFIYFYIENILEKLQPSLFNDFESSDFITDGKGDMNIDFILQDDNQYYLSQSKFIDYLNDAEVYKFFKMNEDIRNQDKINKLDNRHLRAQLLSMPKDAKINFTLLTNSKVSEKVQQVFKDCLDDVQNNLSPYLKDRVEWKLLDYYSIKEQYTEVIEIAKGDPINLHIPLLKNSEGNYNTLLFQLAELKKGKNQPVPKSVVLPVSGLRLADWANKYYTRIYVDNVREPLGINSINQRLVDTIKKEPDKFFLYNNGISALCDYFFVNEEGKYIQVNNMRIINGAQTTEAFAEARKKDIDLNHTFVLLKLTEVKKADDKERQLSDKIVRYNNTQNKVNDSDFLANETIQFDIEKKFKKYKYLANNEPFEIIYRRKRKKYSSKKYTKNISLENLTKLLGSFYIDPSIVRKSKELFNKDDYSHYYDIYGSEKSVTIKKMNEIAAVTILWFYFDKKLSDTRKSLKKQDKEKSADWLANQAKFHYIYLFNSVIKYHHSGKRETIYRHLINGKAFKPNLDKNTWLDQWFTDIKKTILLEIKRDNKKEGFIWANWLRDTEKIKILDDAIEHSSSRIYLFN